MLDGGADNFWSLFYGVTGSGWRLVLPDPQDGKEWSPCFSVKRCDFGGEARREGARTVSLIVILGERKIANTLSLLKKYSE